MTREMTGKTPLSTIKRRYYGTAWVLIGLPLLYILRPSPVGAFGGDGHSIQTTISWWTQFVVTWAAIWVAMHGTTWFIIGLMHLAGAIFNNHPNYQAWLQAGGHPFWDTLYVFNADPPQVRGAISIPPAEPICGNCGASLTGLFGLGSNYGNVCPSCGFCNDTFPER